MRRSRSTLSQIAISISIAVYGAILVNRFDLRPPSFVVGPDYDLFLMALYFLPGILVAIFYRNVWLIPLVGLAVSLMNDMIYEPAGVIWGVRTMRSINANWYLQQLGFLGSEKVILTLSFGIVSVPVTSLLMGISVYVRASIVVILAVYLARRRHGSTVPGTGG